MTTLFVSDLHLEAARPDIGEQFIHFLETEVLKAEELYILGDLFEAWVGDDDPNAHYACIKMALRKVAEAGIPVSFMHGNRDFMVGRRFANETGVEILDDPYPVNLYGRRALLSHGDAFCLDDVRYQHVRRMTRNPEWQASILAKPLEERLVMAAEAREESRQQTSGMDAEIMDVNQDEVKRVIEEYDIEVLVHGHTHRPAVHTVDLDNRKAKRIVLGDWYTQGSVLRWDLRGPRLETMPR